MKPKYVCVWLRVRPTQKRIGSRMQKSRFQPACMEQIYRHRLGAKIVSTPHFGASIHAKAFENSESCLLSPKLAATHISSISASGGGLHHSDQLTLQIWKNRGDIEIYWMSKKTGKGPTQMAPRHKQRKDTPKEMQTTTTCSSISQTRHVTSSRFLMLS